ncbi:hypothetical protein BD408DRAFT_426327 [Parasitella parasitica]|nr:hypothetical protein BD408DRAFT_426327 [Parasitella parasitica]
MLDPSSKPIFFCIGGEPCGETPHFLLTSTLYFRGRAGVKVKKTAEIAYELVLLFRGLSFGIIYGIHIGALVVLVYCARL